LKPTSGLKTGVLKFTKKINDYFRPAITSVSRSAALPGFTSPVMYSGMTPTNPLSMDLLKTTRSPRKSLWDVGAIQYLKVPAKAPWLSSKTTGPRYS
jgi:hypothetical protein